MSSSDSSRTSSARSRRPLWLGGVIGAGLLLAIAVLVALQDLRERRALIADAAIRLADTSAESRAELERRVRYAPDLDRARLAVSRAAVTREIEALRGGLPMSGPRLQWAAELAESTWRSRPESFMAASTVALARWLALWQARDPRMYTEREIWEAPLREALRLAPAENEPRTILLRARLTLWFSLSNSERTETAELARQTFTDPDTFQYLFPAWLAVHDPWTDEAARVVPETGRATRSLRHALSGRGDKAALERMERAIERRAPARLREVLSAEDAVRIDALSWAPPNAAWSGEASQVIEALGGGSLGTALHRDAGEAAAIRAWWDWSLVEVAAGRQALERGALDRFAYAVEAPACERALVALAADDLAAAEALEPTASTMDPCWGRALARKAQVLRSLGRGPAAAAAAELAQRLDPGLRQRVR